MAGNYMDAPAARVAYDRDGSVGVGINNTGVATQLSGTMLQGLNAESESVVTLSTGAWRFAIVFPTPLDLKAFFLSLGNSNTVTIETSHDTTNGLDGTWSQQVSGATYFRDVKPNYRILSFLTSLPAGTANQNLKGIRVVGTATLSVRTLHVYGDAASTATPDRIAAWHPTLDQPLPPTHFDWGNVPRSSSDDQDFRLKNLSGDLIAEDIEVYIEALTPGVPSVAGMHTISDNGGSTFLTSITIPDLDPGEISDVLTLRRVVPDNAQVSVWSARVAADVGTWTEAP